MTFAEQVLATVAGDWSADAPAPAAAPQPSRRPRAKVWAAIAAAMDPDGPNLPEPHTVKLNGDDGGCPGDRVVIWFDYGRSAQVDRWAAWLQDQGVVLDGEPGTGRAYPADVDFRVYRVETGRWAGWRVSLQCRVGAS